MITECQQVALPPSCLLADLIELRIDLDISSARVAEQLGLNASYVRSIESGLRQEPAGFARRYEIALLQAIVKRNQRAAAWFGTDDFAGLVRELSGPETT